MEAMGFLGLIFLLILFIIGKWSQFNERKKKREREMAESLQRERIESEQKQLAEEKKRQEEERAKAEAEKRQRQNIAHEYNNELSIVRNISMENMSKSEQLVFTSTYTSDSLQKDFWAKINEVNTYLQSYKCNL